MSRFPYLDEYEVHRTMPDQGTPREDILAMMNDMASRENVVWEDGHCSGTMYCGDHDHYDFLNEAFSNFSYVNTLQRDMCPERHEVRGRDHRHDPGHARRRRTGGQEPGRPRDLRRLGLDRPRRPGLPRRESLHRAREHDQARDRAPGLRQGRSPLRRGHEDRAGRPGDAARSTSTGCAPTSTPTPWRSSVRRRTTATARSTPSPISARSRSSTASGFTSTAASAASSSPSVANSATTSRPSTSRCPASRPSPPTRISTATR